MCLAIDLVFPQRRVWPANEDSEVPAFGPGAWPDGVPGPALDGQVARFQIEEERGGGFERPEKRGLADPSFPEDAAFDATLFGETLIGLDDGERAHRPSSSRISLNVSLPVRTVRASANAD